MMYTKGNFIACVKVKGKIQKEDSSNVVKLPWGVEYSLFLKNLNSVRAVAKISIDGVDATGAGLILPANGTVDIERFLKDNNLHKGNRFKFIERTANVENHRGIGSDDGIVRVEFWAEQPQPEVIQKIVEVKHLHHYDHPWYPYWYWPYNSQITWSSNAQVEGGSQQFFNCASNNVSQTNTSAINTISETSSSPFRGEFTKSETPTKSRSTRSAPGASRRTMSGQSMLRSTSLNESGITVAGSESDQSFQIGEYFPLTKISHVITLQLRGEVEGKPVSQPVTIKTKKKCSICGKENSPLQKFCGECGTALTII